MGSSRGTSPFEGLVLDFTIGVVEKAHHGLRGPRRDVVIMVHEVILGDDEDSQEVAQSHEPIVGIGIGNPCEDGGDRGRDRVVGNCGDHVGVSASRRRRAPGCFRADRNGWEDAGAAGCGKRPSCLGSLRVVARREAGDVKLGSCW